MIRHGGSIVPCRPEITTSRPEITTEMLMWLFHSFVSKERSNYVTLLASLKKRKTHYALNVLLNMEV